MIHSFLLIGQSNAAGRGRLEEAPPLDSCGGRIKVLRNGRWRPLFRPVNPDSKASGYCLAESFAKAYALAHPDVEVGIVPCAHGDTKLDEWQKGEVLYDHAVSQARLAQRTAKIVGVLWHQGEGECTSRLAPTYAMRFEKMMADIRKDLDLPETPFILGELGYFLGDCPLGDNLKRYVQVNGQLWQVAQNNPHTACVSAEGLTSNKDLLHFNAESLQEFGLRYYTAFKKLCH